MGGDSDPSAKLSTALFGVLAQHAQPDVMAWLSTTLPAASTHAPLPRGAFLARYAGLPRRLGASASTAVWSATEQTALQAAGVPDATVWSLTDVGRAALLLGVFQAIDEAARVALATEIFRRGDTSERVSVLRCLALFHAPLDPSAFVPLAAEACRSHVLDVLAALACENPFPARALPELAWNQMIMKLMFVGLPLERVHAWQSRVNPELVRMAHDFASERRAAGRSVPDDVARIAAEASA